MEEKQFKNSVQGYILDIFHKYFQKNFAWMAKLQLHPGQVPMLRLLRMNEGLSQKEIAGKLNIKPPTVNVSVQRMEKAGLVDRRTDGKDQRITRIYLTEKGREIDNKIAAVMDVNEEIITKNFTESELCLLKRMLQQIRENLDHAAQTGETQSGSWHANCMGKCHTENDNIK